jgi:hypothetical protein
MAPGSNLKISTHGICQEDLILHILTGSIQEVYVPIDQQTNFWLREKSKACFHHYKLVAMLVAFLFQETALKRFLLGQILRHKTTVRKPV